MGKETALIFKMMPASWRQPAPQKPSQCRSWTREVSLVVGWWASITLAAGDGVSAGCRLVPLFLHHPACVTSSAFPWFNKL